MSDQKTGAAGIKITEANLGNNEQFDEVVTNLEIYSQSIVRSFEEVTSRIHTKLNNSGSSAIAKLNMLESSRESLNNLIKMNSEELDQIIAEVEEITKELQSLDSLENEILLLSDLLTTVEDNVKCKPQ
ncbi:hypothetical protein GPJ56_006205 [Histomonas meleagridis]|uniref:uncharacterized protein n=1 Tax=Histomonas meleagridis TaxID=135588 RepID=UPI00355A5AA2|nr:hypothetical protein GPJ56_006205 [Histomonas meleagridis]KAH0796980.1 hypothetical protein GO595_010873 [Histomonas meleagridis]